MRLLRDHRIDVLVLILYIALSLGMTWPLLPQMATHVAGRHMDARVFQWNDWWVRTALLRGQNPFYTDVIYYPNGVSLAGHNVNWVSSLLSVPLSLALGPAVAYNLAFLRTLWLSAFAMYLLARHLTGRRDAAFLAGLAFGFAPYHLSGNWSGQMNLANVQWLPLAALFVLRTLESRRAGDALLAGLFGALASLDCWFFMIFLGMWGVLFLAYALLLERARWRWRTVALYALAAVLFAALVAPFLWPVLSEAGEGTVSGALAYYEETKSSDLLAFTLPSSDHPLFGPATAETYARFSHWRPAFVGYGVLLLAIYGAIAGRRRAVLWWVTALAFGALALGTVLHIGGTAHPAVPTPYRLLTDLLPALKLVRQANRFNVMLSLALAALAGFGAADLFARLERRASAGRLWAALYPAALGLLSAWLLFEYLAVPCPLLPASVSPFYEQLAQEEGDFALLELPLQFLYARRSTYAQTVHGKRLVNGYVARAVPEDSGFVASSPLLKALDLRMAPDPALVDIPAEMARLAANGVRYVVIHKAPMPPHPAVEPDVLASWRALFGPAPVYEDQELIAYRLPEAAAAERAPLFEVGGVLAGTEIDLRRVEVIGHPFLQVDVTWHALRPVEQTYAVDLVLIGPAGEAAGAASWTISPAYPTDRWPAGVLVADRYRLPIAPGLAAGRYRLAVRVYEVGSGQEMGVVEHPFDLPGEAQPLAPFLDQIPTVVDAVFGDELWLLGYGARQEGTRLMLDVYWQALVRPAGNYKIFVHLIRPADGAIVAQQDTMPRGWSYPTSLWSRLEVFVDRLELDLTGVPPGEYRLAVGVYVPDGPRLAAIDAQGQRAPDDRLLIETPIAIR